MLTLLNELHEQEKQLKNQLAKTFLQYFESLSPNKRLRQMESLLYEIPHRNLPTLDRRLTPQENNCLYLASQGKEIKESAHILGLSQRTIKYHRANIVKKLDVPNLMAAVGLRAQAQYLQSGNPFFSLKQVLMSLPGNVFWKDKEGYYLGCNVSNCM